MHAKEQIQVTKICAPEFMFFTRMSLKPNTETTYPSSSCSTKASYLVSKSSAE